MTYLIYLFFGLAPSIIWLLFFLRKDVHPESNRMILRIFLYGMLIALPALFVEIGLSQTFSKIPVSRSIISILNIFLGVAFIEEFLKYLVVREKVLKDSELDEPIDLMLYMIIAALGFAAVENILYLFMPASQLSFNYLVSRTLIISFVRFIGATFLHTLSSATVGYYLALSFCQEKNKKMYVFGGIFIATALHGLYNFSIMTLEGPVKIAIPIAILIILAFLVFSEFEKLKKIKGVCKV